MTPPLPPNAPDAATPGAPNAMPAPALPPGAASARHLDAIFAFLIAATGVTWWVGESGSAGPAAVALILALALVKGWLVVRDFMGLRRAGLLWNLLVGGWLVVILSVIAATYWKALS